MTGDPAAAADAAPAFMTFAVARWRVLLAVFLSQGLIGFSAYGVQSWAPTLLIHRFHASATSTGLTLGAMTALCGVAGALAGLALCDRWAAAGMRAARFKVSALAMMLGLPAALALATAPSVGLVCVCLGIVYFAAPMAGAAGPAMVQELFPNRLRGQATAVLVLFIGLCGSGLGPLAVGLGVDRLFGDEGLARAMALAVAPAMLAVCLIYLLGRRAYPLPPQS